MLCYPLSCIAIYVMHTKTTPDSHLWAKFVLRFAREGAKPFAPNSFTFRHETKKNGNHFIRLDFFFGKMAMHSSDPSISKPISDVESARTPNECESLKSCSSKNSKKSQIYWFKVLPREWNLSVSRLYFITCHFYVTKR